MQITKLIGGLATPPLKIIGGTDADVQRLCCDSRENAQDSLFFCLTGGEKDGHNYAHIAMQKGAKALVVERELNLPILQVVVENTRIALAQIASAFYGYPSERMQVIAITGTNGKTTTANMLAALLKADGKKVGVIGTLGARYLAQTIASTLTTPDPIQLQALLARMAIEGITHVVMEASAHALYYHKTFGMRFAACIFTNLTHDHLDFFATPAAYKQAKARLFTMENCPIAILNGDDPVGREFGALRENNDGVKTLYYGLQTPTDAFALITDENIHRTECVFNLSDKLCRVSLHCIGKHNVYNALAAACCALELGVNVSSLRKGFLSLSHVDGRLQKVASIDGANIFIDYAHTPDGLKNALQTLKSHCQGKLICLFGCGGNRDKSKRVPMGETAAKLCDFCVLTSDNPRYEDPLDILSQVEKGYRRFSQKYVMISQRARAIEYALDLLGKGDILLVAGKGAEEYQEIMGIKYPFSDHNIIKNIIGGKREEFPFETEETTV